MITMYAAHKASKGYEIVKLEFPPLQFKNRKVTHYSFEKTKNDVYDKLMVLNGCK